MKIPQIITPSWPIPEERVIDPLDLPTSIRILWPVAELPDQMRDVLDIVVPGDGQTAQYYAEVVATFCDSVLFLEPTHCRPGCIPPQAVIKYDELQHIIEEQISKVDTDDNDAVPARAFSIYRRHPHSGQYLPGFIRITDDPPRPVPVPVPASTFAGRRGN